MDKVSIIIPTYKRSVYLCNAIDSALAQTYTELEIIVVDDNGIGTQFQQETEKLMEKYKHESRVTYLPLEKNCGGAVARNAGINAATGELIAFLDDDDEYLPEKIEVQVSQMQKKGWDVSVMDGATYNEKDELLSRKIQRIKNGMSKEELMAVHLMYHISGTNTFMFRAQAIRAIGGFMDIVACQEYMLMMKALEAGLTVGYINETLIKNYIREGERLSTGEKKYKAEKIMYSAKKKHFDCLKPRQRRFVSCRHYGVLGYVQLKRKKYFSALSYLAAAVFCSPAGAYSIFKEYKGKLMQ